MVNDAAAHKKNNNETTRFLVEFHQTTLNSQRFLQFHPTAMLVTYGSSCFIIIRQKFFPVSFSGRIMQLKLSYESVDRHFFSATTGFPHA
jgi:hypothetical protein